MNVALQNLARIALTALVGLVCGYGLKQVGAQVLHDSKPDPK